VGPVDNEDTLDPSVPPSSEPDEAHPSAPPGGGDPATADATADGRPPTLSDVSPAVDEGATSNDGNGDEDAPGLEERRRKRKRSYLIGSIAGVLIAVIVATAFVRVPYYRFAPGTLYPTQPLITVDGAPTYDTDGPIEFTTVSSKKVSVLELGLAKLDPAVKIVDADEVEGTSTVEEMRQLNLEAMDDAKKIAEVIALRQLGYDVVVTGTGAVVRGVGEGMPAEGILDANDTIVAIDGQPVTTASEAVDAIGARVPGDSVTLRIEPISADGVKGDPKDEVVTLGARPDDDTKALLGVSMGTRDTQFDLPVSISIDSRDVGGPSAGLALTLGIIDKMTPGSLTGGNRVAVTGTIDLDGNVGVIGGIQQKTFLATRSGVKVFIVPADEAEDARGFAGPGLQVIGVRTIDEAMEALAGLGGDIEVVEQTASAAGTPPGSTGP
jgi:PDZ domain-containing protein